MPPELGHRRKREVKVPRVAEEVPQLNEQTVRHMTETKNSNVPTPALWAARTHDVFGVGLCRCQPRDY